MHAQNTSFESRKVQAEYVGQFDPKSSQNEVISFMYPTGAPIPGGNSYKSFLLEQKINQDYRSFPKQSIQKKSTTASKPSTGFGTSLYRMTPQGNPYDFTGGIPNDNAMAISKGRILCAAVNSVFWA